MKKIYNLLALVIMFTIAVGAQARDRFWTISEETPDPVVEAPEAGQAYFLVKGNAGSDSRNYLSHDGSMSTSYATRGEVWYFEPVGENQYRIYFEADGVKQYVFNGSGDSFTTSLTTRIGTFSFQPAEYRENDEAAAEEELVYYTTTNGNVVAADTEIHTLLAFGTGEEGSPVNYLHWTGAVNTNTVNNYWYVIPAQEMSDDDYVDAYLFYLFGDNGFDEEAYPVGANDPGYYDEDALNAFKTALDEFDGSEESADALDAAYDALLKSFVPFGEGYYVLNTFRSERGVLFDNSNNVAGATKNMYTITDPAVAITNTGGNFSISADFDIYDPSQVDEEGVEEWMKSDIAGYFVWHVTKADVVDGQQMYYFQNFQTKNYIGGAPKNADGSLKPSNSSILVTATPEASYNMQPSAHYVDGKRYWTLYSDELTKKGAWGGTTWAMGGLHAPGDVMNLVTWDATSDGSCWYPRLITEDDLAIISGGDPERGVRMAELKTLVEQAQNAIENNKAYAFFNAEGARVNLHEYTMTEEVDGLVFEEDQISSNATHANDGQGIAGLVDNDFATYYHSAWSNDYAPEAIEIEDPENEGEYISVFPRVNLTFDLRKSVEAATIKWFGRKDTRNDQRVSGLPVKVRVLAADDLEAEEWDVIEEELDVLYEPRDAEHYLQVISEEAEEPETHELHVGVIPVKFEKPYSCIRIELVKNVLGQTYEQSETFNTKLYFNASEVRVYNGITCEYKYDAENSKIEAVPADVRTALENALATAKQEIEEKNATQETIDALKNALDAFKSHIADPDAVREALEEARKFQNAVEAEELIGSEIGYFQNGADNELRAALDKIQITSTSTVEECQKALAAIKKALADFNSKLVKPANGKYYYIKSRTTGGETWYNNRVTALEGEGKEPTEQDGITRDRNYADNDYVGVFSTTPYSIGWGAEGAELAHRQGYLWQSVSNEDGTFSLRHVLSGLMLGAPHHMAVEKGETNDVALVDSVFTFTYQSAKKPGVLNLVFGDKVYLNAQPGTNNVVIWNSADGYDNSAFEFVEAVEPETDYITVDLTSDQGYQIVTLPYNVSVYSQNYCPVYRSIGYKQDGEDYYMEFKQYADGETIEAGTPFVVNRAAAATEAGLGELWFGVEKMGSIFVGKGKTANGMIGFLADFDEIEDATEYLVFGKYNNEWSIVAGSKSNKPVAGSGFIVNNVPVATEAGDLSILCPDGLNVDEEGIQSIVESNTVAVKGTFNLMGQKVNGQLPAGLYIINSKKVVVK